MPGLITGVQTPEHVEGENQLPYSAMVCVPSYHMQTHTEMQINKRNKNSDADNRAVTSSKSVTKCTVLRVEAGLHNTLHRMAPKAQTVSGGT